MSLERWSKVQPTVNREQSFASVTEEHGGSHKKHVSPNAYQCLILRAMAKGDRLFLETREVTITEEWEFGKEIKRPKTKKTRLVAEVIMSGGMDPNVWDVRFLEKRGYLQKQPQEGRVEFILTQKGRDLVTANSTYIPPKEFTNAETYEN